MSDASYANQIFQLTLEQADRQGGGLLTQEKNSAAYLSFLVGAITVPFHESQLQQFRMPTNGETGRCFPQTNSAIEKASDPQASALFEHYIAKEAPACSQIPDPQTSTHLLLSYDRKSMGLFQENFREHPEFVDTGDFLDVSKTTKDGLALYFEGFTQVLAKSASFPCLKATESGEVLNWENLVHGAWSGPYNSGNDAPDKVCRFDLAYLNAQCASRTPGEAARCADDKRWRTQNDIPFGNDFAEVLNVKSGYYAHTLADRALEEYDALLAIFLRLDGDPKLTSAEIDAAAESVHKLLNGGAPAAPATPAAPAPVLAAAPKPVLAGGEGEVASEPTAPARQAFPATMYVPDHADLYLNPSVNEDLRIATVFDRPNFPVTALRRLDTRASAEGPITGHWIEIALPSDPQIDAQIASAIAKLPGGSRPHIKAGTRVYVQAPQLASAPGEAHHYFRVQLHSGRLMLHTGPSGYSPIRDYATKDELVEGVEFYRVKNPVGWLTTGGWEKIYSPAIKGELWASMRYLVEVKAVESPANTKVTAKKDATPPGEPTSPPTPEGPLETE